MLDPGIVSKAELGDYLRSTLSNATAVRCLEPKATTERRAPFVEEATIVGGCQDKSILSQDIIQ